MFLDRERHDNGPWTGRHIEVPNRFNFYLQAHRHLQCGEFNGKPFRGHCPAGAINVIMPHETVFPSGVGASRFLQVSISETHFLSLTGGRLIDPKAIERRRGFRTDFGLHRLARAHEAGLTFGPTGDELYFQVLRQAIVNRLVALHSIPGKKARNGIERLVPATAKRVVDFIEANLAQHLRLAELSAVAGVSRAHFARAFHATIGVSPHAFVIHRRLTLAATLLKRRQMPVHEIARLCGFADHAHLTRQFKASFGVAPSSFGSKIDANLAQLKCHALGLGTSQTAGKSPPDKT